MIRRDESDDRLTQSQPKPGFERNDLNRVSTAWPMNSVDAASILDEELTFLGFANRNMRRRDITISNDDIVRVGTPDGGGERLDACALAHATAPIEYFDEDYSFHEIVSRYQRTSASALS